MTVALFVNACAAVSTDPAPGAPAAARQLEVLQRLVKSQRRSGAQHDYVHFDIDGSALRAVQTRPELRERLSDPLAAARTLAPALGIPPGSEFTVVGRTGPDHTEAGWALATVLVTYRDGRTLEVRMIAAPGARPAETVWVPNDALERRR